MGRPPCCDKVGIKKGPWTPQEDVILVSYIQQHGPGNWSAVPINTGLLRCSKSCRLRWTNYLRPGIKRGNFTPHEEGMIVHLQSLLGNKWASIATYLPRRTDNDIKNYWNTHLKKKLKRFQSISDNNSVATYHHQLMMSNNNVHDPNSSSLVYASSEENISRLLGKWMRPSSNEKLHSDANSSLLKCDTTQEIDDHGENNDVTSSNSMDDQLQCIFPFDSAFMRSGPSGKSSHCDSSARENVHNFLPEEKIEGICERAPLSFLENWLMDDDVSQVEGDRECLQILKN